MAGDGKSKVADLMVISGITGDPAQKMTFRALYRLVRRELLDCPIVGGAGGNCPMRSPLGAEVTCTWTYRYGAFVRMVHNGIEYGMMASLAEGLNILHHADIGTAPSTAAPKPRRWKIPSITATTSTSPRWPRLGGGAV